MEKGKENKMKIRYIIILRKVNILYKEILYIREQPRTKVCCPGIGAFFSVRESLSQERGRHLIKSRTES